MHTTYADAYDVEERHGETPAARRRRGVRTGSVAPLFFVAACATQAASQITLL